MFFLLKRSGSGGLAGLVVLGALGLVLRRFVVNGPAFDVSWMTVALGFVCLGAILLSDLVLGGLLFLIRPNYAQRKSAEFADLFRGQSLAAMTTGGLMAGCGEELIFRGLSLEPGWLMVLAVLFGCCHYVRRSLLPIALWAVYEGLLLAAALLWTQSLMVAMIAHFLHDLVGFLLLGRYRAILDLARSNQ